MSSGRNFSAGVGFVMQTLQQDTDDLQFALMLFSDSTTRWPGIPEPGGPRPVREGWAALPSEEALSRAREWLGGRRPFGETFAGPALNTALRDEQAQLTVIMVSDGIFGDDTWEQHFAEGQAWREEQGLPEAVVIALDTKSSDRVGEAPELMDVLGRIGRGGCFRLQREPEPPLPPVAPNPSQVPPLPW